MVSQVWWLLRSNKLGLSLKFLQLFELSGLSVSEALLDVELAFAPLVLEIVLADLQDAVDHDHTSEADYSCEDEALDVVVVVGLVLIGGSVAV